jgi:hypothetical protein
MLRCVKCVGLTPMPFGFAKVLEEKQKAREKIK